MASFTYDEDSLGSFKLIAASRGGIGTDLSPLVKTLSWDASLQNAATTITADLIPYEGLFQLLDLAELIAIFGRPSEGGPVDELTRGFLWTREGQDSNKGVQITAYDLLKYMLENKDEFAMYGVRASDVFTQLCTQFNLPFDPPPDTGYVIPHVIMRQTSPYEALVKALVVTRDVTGRRFFPRVVKGRLTLYEPKLPSLVWALEPGNIIKANFKETLDGFSNKVKVLGHQTGATQADGGQTAYVMHEESDHDAIAKYGLLQTVRYHAQHAKNKVDASTEAKQVLKKLNRVKRIADIDSIGVVSLWPGDIVYAKEVSAGLLGIYYVENVKNEVKAGLHTMNLRLRLDDLLTDPRPEV